MAGKKGAEQAERSTYSMGHSFPLCRSIFPFSTIFLLPKRLPVTLLLCGSVGDVVSKLQVSENAFILPLFLKDTFAGYRSLGWHFPPQYFEDGAHHLLTCIVSSGESHVLSLFLTVEHYFFLISATFKIFALSQTLSGLIMLCLDVIFLMFPVFDVDWGLGSVDLAVLLCLENFSATRRKSHIISVTSSHFPVTRVSGPLKLCHSLMMVCSFLLIYFFLWVSFWIVSITVASSSLIFSPALCNPLLISSSRFFSFQT